MGIIIEFPSKSNGQADEIKQVIKKRLEEFGASEDMVANVTNRMNEFLKLTSFNIPMNFEISEEYKSEFIERIVPEIERMQAKLKERMNELIYNRLVHEIELYRLGVRPNA